MNNSPDDGKVGYLPKSPKWGSWETTKSNKEGDNVKIDKMKLDLAMANKAYSAKELSQKCGVSQVTIVRITKGVQEARPGTVGKIAKALKVPVTDIIKNTAATVDNGKQGISEAK